MNSWLLIRRLRAPAFVILVGVNALLNQWGILSFGRSWPFYLILGGVLGLAERAALLGAPAAQPYPAPYMPGTYASPAAYPPPAVPYTTPTAPYTAPPSSSPDDPEGRKS
jgi:hypothetical protein